MTTPLIAHPLGVINQLRSPTGVRGDVVTRATWHLEEASDVIGECFTFVRAVQAHREHLPAAVQEALTLLESRMDLRVFPEDEEKFHRAPRAGGRPAPEA